MDDRQLLLQRYYDGECKPIESQAMQELLLNDSHLQVEFEALGELDDILEDRDVYEQELQIESIMSRIPQGTPQRQLQITTGIMAMWALICSMALSAFAYQYNIQFQNILTLSLLTCLMIATAVLALFLSAPKSIVSDGLLKRCSEYKINVSNVQSNALRCASAVLIVMCICIWSF